MSAAERNDPGELIPVEEWEAEERRRGAGVERGKAEAGKRKEQGALPQGAVAVSGRERHWVQNTPRNLTFGSDNTAWQTEQKR